MYIGLYSLTGHNREAEKCAQLKLQSLRICWDTVVNDVHGARLFLTFQCHFNNETKVFVFIALSNSGEVEGDGCLNNFFH